MEIDTDVLVSVDDIDRLRNVGYDLEALDEVDGEVRGRGWGELAEEIARAVEEAGDSGVDVLENFGLGDAVVDELDDSEDDSEDLPEVDFEIVQIVSNPARSGLSIGDILADPLDIVTRSVPYRPLDGLSEALEALERPDTRFNESFSNETLPGLKDDSEDSETE